MRNIQRMILLFTFTFIFELHADDKPHRFCHDALGHLTLPKIDMFNSGRDVDMQPARREAALIIYRDIALRLGLRIPDMVLKDLTDSDMAALTANAGHPAPHWVDGKQVMENAARAGNILEFVEPGRSSHVQFGRDANSIDEDLIVYPHVSGHYDFFLTSYLFRMRDPDRIRDSWALAALMTKLYSEKDYELVSLWYQWLLSTNHLQDLARGSFEPPERFKPREIENGVSITPSVDPLSLTGMDVEQTPRIHPQSPSLSVLQSFVENLSSTAPSWKKEMLKHFEKLHRVGPAIMQTKIMNEGWASFVEFIQLSHSKWNTPRNIIDFAGHTWMNFPFPMLRDPYWLGFQGWYRLYQKFLERPEMIALKDDPFEQDKRFVAYAHTIIERYIDFSFLQMALDEKWIEKNKLFLFRKATSEEKKNVWWEEKNICVTLDPQRVARLIAHHYANWELRVPLVEIVDFNFEQSGVVLFRHKPVNGVPLSRRTVAKTLYVLAQILERPVALDTIGSNMWWKPKQEEWRLHQGGSEFDSISLLQTYPLRITVTPQGKVNVRVEISEGVRIPDKLEENLQASVDAYKLDIDIGTSKYPSTATSPKLKALITAAIAKQEVPVSELPDTIGHAPTAADAVLKYKQFIRHRMKEVLKLATSGKWPVHLSDNGKFVHVRIFPEIPEFELDRRVRKRRKGYLPPTPLDVRFNQTSNRPGIVELLSDSVPSVLLSTQEKTFEREGLEDEDLEIGFGDRLPGDMWDRPPPGKGCCGEGEDEDGEGEEPGEGAGGGAGPGGMDGPSDMKIPIEDFSKMLAELIELRNLRKVKSGENPEMDTIRTGSVHRVNGLLREEQTAENDYAKGIAMIISRGEDPSRYTQEEILLEGMRLREPEDFVVAHREPDPLPDMNAVIVFVADTSGSMGDEHRAIERKMVAFISGVLSTIYPQLKKRFVIYGGGAKEVTEEEFYNVFEGGGTVTESGLKKAQEILKEYPPAQFNRFMHLFSDGEDFEPQSAVAFLKQMVKDIEYFGYGHVDPWGGGPNPWGFEMMGELSRAFEELSKVMKDKVGYAELNQSFESLVRAIKIYYGKQKK